MSNSRMEIRGCTSLFELEEVVELCDAAFPKTPREYFERHVLKDGTLSRADTRVLLKDGRIVSSVQVFPRTIYILGEKIGMGGIGNVATLPAERNKGYAAMVMRDAIGRIEELNLPISLLTTTINGYYENFGFKTVNRSIGTINMLDGHECPRVRVFDRDCDLEKLTRLYDCYNKDSNGPIVRDAAYWNSQFEFCGEDPGLFFVYDDADGILAYVRAKKEVDKVQVLEHACTEGRDGLLREMFAHLAVRANQPRLELFVSNRERARLASMDFMDSKVDTDMMVRVNKRDLDSDPGKELLREFELTFWLTDFF